MHAMLDYCRGVLDAVAAYTTRTALSRFHLLVASFFAIFFLFRQAVAYICKAKRFRLPLESLQPLSPPHAPLPVYPVHATGGNILS